MSIQHSLPRKVVSGLAAAGTLLGLTMAAPAAVASTSSGAGASHLTGAGGQTTGALTQASQSLSAYWAKAAPKAKELSVVSSGHASASANGSAGASQAKPQGPAHLVAGALGSVNTKATAARPALGSTGTNWWGNFWSAPATTTGKIFFTDHKGGNWVCSGSLVNSAAKNVVITAGHCVYGTAGGELPSGETWHSNWVFAPDYSNGSAPFGYWTTKQLWTITNYINNGDEQDDLGAAILNKNSSGQNAVNLLGGQGIAWNQSSSQYVYDFGYPAESPFNGATLQECDGSAGWNGWPWVDMEMLSCNFTGGSSGGPWLMNFNGSLGYINSVNDANGYWLFGGQMGGLYFGNNAGTLYNTVASL